MNTEDTVRVILNGLSDLIRSNLVGAAHEQYFPCSNPDNMDARIKQGKDRAAALRSIREEFENVVTGIII